MPPGIPLGKVIAAEGLLDKNRDRPGISADSRGCIFSWGISVKGEISIGNKGAIRAASRHSRAIGELAIRRTPGYSITEPV